MRLRVSGYETMDMAMGTSTGTKDKTMEKGMGMSPSAACDEVMGTVMGLRPWGTWYTAIFVY